MCVRWRVRARADVPVCAYIITMRAQCVRRTTCVRMCVYVRAFVRVCGRKCVRTRVCACDCAHVRVCVNDCRPYVRASVVRLRARVRADVPVCAYIITILLYMRAQYVHTCVRMYVCVRTCICTCVRAQLRMRVWVPM